MTIVQRLYRILPDDYTAEPRVHLGSYFEIDVCAYEDNESRNVPSRGDFGGGATATYTAPEPTLVIDADLTGEYSYEVLVDDQAHGRHLVGAAIGWVTGLKGNPHIIFAWFVPGGLLGIFTVFLLHSMTEFMI